MINITRILYIPYRKKKKLIFHSFRKLFFYGWFPDVSYMDMFLHIAPNFFSFISYINEFHKFNLAKLWKNNMLQRNGPITTSIYNHDNIIEKVCVCVSSHLINATV